MAKERRVRSLAVRAEEMRKKMDTLDLKIKIEELKARIGRPKRRK